MSDSADPTANCFVCNDPPLRGQINNRVSGELYDCTCPRCGDFLCKMECVIALLQFSHHDRIRLSGAIRELNERQLAGESVERILLQSDMLMSLLANAPSHMDVATKARKLLSAVARRSRSPASRTNFTGPVRYALAFAEDDHEFSYLLNYTEQMGWIGMSRGIASDELWLTPKGWEEFQRRPRLESAQGFVAMRFHSSTDDAYFHGLARAIADCGYRPLRIDNAQFNGDIVDRLMAEIRESRFVVADLTGHRRGVYFEAGFALGLDIPVIWTCHSDRAGKTHFDAEHFNQIRWNTPAELCDKLQIRIRATIGRGPLKSHEEDHE